MDTALKQEKPLREEKKDLAVGVVINSKRKSVGITKRWFYTEFLNTHFLKYSANERKSHKDRLLIITFINNWMFTERRNNCFVLFLSKKHWWS